MYPTAAVSGWYFSHPQSTYFGVGQITPEQVEDLAQRKGMTVPEMTRWLQPLLKKKKNQTLCCLSKTTERLVYLGGSEKLFINVTRSIMFY